MATKTPVKGKKATASKESAPRKSRGKGSPATEASRPTLPEPKPKPRPRDDDGEEEEEDDDDEAPKSASPPVKKEAAPKARAAGVGEDPPQVVPARRLTPEAKARVNEMVKKGVSLQEALRAAASWETFVAPVKEEPAKLVQGRSFEGGRPVVRDEEPEEDEAESHASTDESD